MITFKLTTKDNGKTYIVRPLLNPKNPNRSVLGFKVRYNFKKYEWVFQKLCFALVNDKLQIFQFSDNTHKYLSPELFLMNSNKAVKITVNVVDEEYLICEYEIIEENKYRFDDTDEKRNYIKTLLTQTELDLTETLNAIKLEIGHVEVKLPTSNGDFKIKTLKEIYDAE